ncbi:MAG: TrmB family transcriptional regulator [Lautropia sp.]
MKRPEESGLAQARKPAAKKGGAVAAGRKATVQTSNPSSGAAVGEKRPSPIRDVSLREDSLSRDLQALGFSDYEARAYIALLKANPATAYEVSKAAGLPRANTYSALESCTEKGAVQPFSERPVRYVPIEPDVLLGRIADATQARCQHLVARLGQLKVAEDRDFVWNIEGAKKVHEKISEMIGQAENHVWIKAHEEVVDAHASELKSAAARGVELLIILFGEDARRFQFNRRTHVYLHEGNGVRVGNADNLFTITTDFSTALTANMRGDVHAAYTRSGPVVTMAESLIRHDMYLAEIFMRFGAQIDEAFGPFMLSLRKHYFSPSQLTSLNETLRRLSAPAG